MYIVHIDTMYKVHYNVTGCNHDGYCSGMEANEEDSLFTHNEIAYVMSDFELKMDKNGIVEESELAIFDKRHDGCTDGNQMCSGFYQEYACTFAKKMTDVEIYEHEKSKIIKNQQSIIEKIRYYKDYLSKVSILLEDTKNKLNIVNQKSAQIKKKLINANDSDKLYYGGILINMGIDDIINHIEYYKKDYDDTKKKINELEEELINTKEN